LVLVDLFEGFSIVIKERNLAPVLVKSSNFISKAPNAQSGVHEPVISLTFTSTAMFSGAYGKPTKIKLKNESGGKYSDMKVAFCWSDLSHVRFNYFGLAGQSLGFHVGLKMWKKCFIFGFFDKSKKQI
jgi:hypothetical protein